jgi:vanillin dehydrogenase
MTLQTSHFINGQWTDHSGPTFPVYNPLNDELVAEAAAGGAAEAEAAVAAAAAAFPAWANLAPGARQALFLKAADIVDRRHEELVQLMAIEGGASRAFSSWQIRLSAAMLRQAAGWGYLPAGDVMRSDIPGRTAMVTRKPLGVVAGFTPWNGAFYLAWRTFLLPMAFGNTTVIKPSELAPRSAGLVHAEILEEAGFPAGTFNVITHAPGEAAAIS